MSRSTRHVDRYTGIRKWSEAEMAREKSLQDEIDAAAKRYRRKEFWCMIAYYGCWVAIGIFIALYLLNRNP